jgi:predicted Rossmann fold nucleotide-binding protein DprA/Smf involved in DNA uptake
MAWQISEQIREEGKKVGIVGARALPPEYKEKVAEVTKYLLSKEYQIHLGGAFGADQYALEALISSGAISKGVLFSAWSTVAGFPREVQKYVEYFSSHRGKVLWGLVPPHSSRSVAIAGLLSRNQRLVYASSGIVAFLYGDSNGTKNTIRKAIERGLKVVVFLCGGGAVLPSVSSGRWVELRCGEPWKGAHLYKR